MMSGKGFHCTWESSLFANEIGHWGKKIQAWRAETLLILWARMILMEIENPISCQKHLLRELFLIKK